MKTPGIVHVCTSAVLLLSGPVVIHAQSNCVSVPSGLVAWWRAENSTADDSITGANGSPYGGISFAPGKVGAAFAFNGVNGGMNVPDVPALALTNSITIETWVYVTNFPSVPGMIIFRGDTRSGLDPYWISLESDGTLKFAITDESNSSTDVRTVMPTGAWTHIAGTLDGSTGLLTLYTNSVIADQKTTPIRPLRSLDANFGAGIGIGNHSSQPGPFNYPFKGLIDELSIYSRALSAGEIQGIYNADSAGKCFSGVSPSITIQPAGEDVAVGATVTFSVAATGTSPLTYQWLKDGNSITGALGTSYIILNAQTNDSGAYSVIVSNAFGWIPSSNAVLTVTGVPPAITSQPIDNTVIIGANASFSVSASGTAPLAYQWLKNGGAIDGATQTSYSLSNVQTNDAAGYSVIVSNLYGYITSSNAQLTVVPAPTNCAGMPSGLVSWWRAEGNASDAQNVANGTIYSAVNFVPGKAGLAFSFNGVNSAINIPDVPALALTNSISVEGWVYVTNAPSVTGMIIFRGDTRSGLDPYFMSVEAGGLLKFAIINQANNSTDVRTTMPTGAWTHLAGTLDDSTGILTLYTNGVIADQKTTTIRPLGPLDPSFGAGVGIGNHSSQPGSFNYPFKGLIDELSVYNRALTQTEVQSIYAAGTAGKCTVPTAPFIVTEPQSQVTTVGANATFNVVAGGSAPLGYQWSFNGTNIDGANTSSYAVSNVQPANAGIYAVVVSNSVSSIPSSNATLTVTLPPANVQVGGTNIPGGGSIILPVTLLANGDENALSFSLNFDPAKLIYVGTALGTSGGDASWFVNESQAASGKIGLALALQTGETFPPGSQELFQISFTAAVVTNSVTTSVTFGDVPTGRQLSDAPGDTLDATYTGSTVAIAGVDLEGDVSPRPGGNKTVSVTDWVLVGRYAARLDYPTNSAEFQRADCAPRSTLGDGRISVTDWVQAGRYAVGLDPMTAAGGPSSESPLVSSNIKYNGPRPLNSRQVKAGDVLLLEGLKGIVPISMQAVGNENAAGFTLSFDPANVSFVSAALGSAAGGATLNLNTSQLASGRLGIAMALSTGSHFAAGLDELVKVTFQAAPTASGNFPVGFGDQLIYREVSDPSANALIADYVSGTITINPLPTIKILSAGQNVTLSWPAWATNFVLQQTDTGLAPGHWSNTSLTIGNTNNESFVTVPLNAGPRFYRLFKP